MKGNRPPSPPKSTISTKQPFSNTIQNNNSLKDTNNINLKDFIIKVKLINSRFNKYINLYF